MYYEISSFPDGNIYLETSESRTPSSNLLSAEALRKGNVRRHALIAGSGEVPQFSGQTALAASRGATAATPSRATISTEPSDDFGKSDIATTAKTSPVYYAYDRNRGS